MKEVDFVTEVTKRSTPLRNNQDLGNLINSIKDKKVVMLGESTHGTREFYEWRAEISKELILNHGFNFIAVEGDWPPSQEVHQFITDPNILSAESALSHFSRWPTWMWANSEVLNLIMWLKQTNYSLDEKVGFYGLDVYSLYESMDKVVDQLLKIDRSLALSAASYYSCFENYRHDEKAYARSLFNVPEGCKKGVLNVLNETLNYRLKNDKLAPVLFDAIQNAKIVQDAENYYRAMVLGDEDSWNVRDEHMMDTLKTLLDHYGPEAKGIVWEHNTHIGDYRATDMLVYGQVNIGGLAREMLGQDKVALVGFTTYGGQVIASNAWDGPITTMNLPYAREGSVEAFLHKAIKDVGCDSYYVNLTGVLPHSPLMEHLGQRAVGVVYHPPSEHRGNYVPTSLARRYDHMVFIDQTKALSPIDTVAVDHEKIPETYPFGAHI